METSYNYILFFKKMKQFKSYYVVWKHAEKYEVECMVHLFKSYYVVWKPEKTYASSKRLSCLNRTMQYGNGIVDPPDEKKEESLNRTMQYGNSSALGR